MRFTTPGRLLSICTGLIISLNISSQSNQLNQLYKPLSADAAIGQWIWQAEDGPANTWVCFRKSFDLTEDPTEASTIIAVDSKYWLWVNGEMVVFEGGLKQGPTPNDSYYDVLDISSYLHAGTNTLAVMVWYFGKQGFSHIDRGKGGLFFECNAGSYRVFSNNSWKVKVHPAFESTSGSYEPNFRLPESNVRFNAANDDMGNWYDPGYDDSAWSDATEKGTPPDAPWGELWMRPIPQWINSGLQDYESLGVTLPYTTTSQKTISAKLPYNLQLTPYLDITAPAGLTIDIRTDGYEPNSHVYSLRAEYVTKEGNQQYESPGWINGHYVKYTIPAGVTVNALKYRESGYDCDFAGSFICNEDFFNVLWTKSQRTLYINMRDTYMDCPDRERGLWWGDVVLEIGEAFYALDRKSDLLAQKSISNLVEWQKENYELYAPVPAGNWDRELPAQTLASIGPFGFWTYYMYTGDEETIEDAYPHVKNYLTIWQLDADGLVVHRGGDWNYDGPWDWTDWGSNIDLRALDNCWYYLALQAAKDMAVLTGNGEDTLFYEERMTSIEDNFNRVIWQGDYYKSPGYTGEVDDRANGLAVLAGLADEAKYDKIRTVLANYRNASPYMEKYVLEALYIMGFENDALTRMKRQDRYGAMVSSSSTTLYETFGNNGTFNHGWSGGPLTLLCQYGAGIAPETPGFETYHVLPQTGDLTSIETVVPSVQGNIELAINKTADLYSIELLSPTGTMAKIGIPVLEEAGTIVSAITINGTEVWKDGNITASVTGIEYLGESQGYYMFSALPGTYTFSATLEASSVETDRKKTFAELNVFPVPSEDRLTITNDTCITRIEIFSSDGRKLKSKDTNAISVDLDTSELDPGLYYLHITNDDNISVTRSILQI